MREGDTYHVFVGDNFIRHYKEDTLPDCIKSRLTMILAHTTQLTRDEDLMKMEIYMPSTLEPEFDEIGWQSSDSYFCIVLPHQDLISLRGESIDRRRYVNTRR